MNDVRLRLSTVLVLLGITAAGAFAAGRSTSGSSSSSASNAPSPPGPAVAEHDFAPAGGDTTELPPGHPPVGAAGDMGDPAAAAAAEVPETPLRWRVPKRWETIPNASSMRLATYRVPPDAEVTVTQAGGSVDANAERWIGQFDEAARKGARRTTRKVHGLDVTVVEVSGHYGGGMSSDAGGSGFALVGVIVATPGMPHFFKLTGPAKTVAAARSEVDELVGSLELSSE